ncbi:phosphoribosylglycinamide formyltransferase [Aliikangiella maris]|uniref:Phosphoribosylglycinamide formyltransferase n=2 Tax=Aliikangiella maris TaxID=3162458 RepID=A0ABV3MI55_9GAMM
MNKNIVILISGSGSNLQSFIDSIKNQQLDASIAAVISNKADAYGLQRATQNQIPTHVIEHGAFETREAFDKQLAQTIEQYQPRLVVLAGFMRILSPTFVNIFHGRLLNIHPSLLPKYPGLHTHQRALDSQDEYHGSSVHFVTEELDGGPIIAQARLKLATFSEPESLQKAVQQLEHQLYPKVAAWFLGEQITMKDNGVYFESKKLEQPIVIDDFENSQ